MKAIHCRQYGSPDVLTLEEAGPPTPADDEVLVKVHAASVNSWDWDNLRGRPIVVRVWQGVLKPKFLIPGADVAGRVEAVGRSVKRFAPGDEVFGDLCSSGWGAFAEYACAREDALVTKPAGVSFVDAAAAPQAAVMALQGIRDYGRTRPGHKVLINGAGGGVGTYAIQLAKSYGAEVTAVDRASKLETLRELGADHVIDFEREDFTQSGKRYDVILDPVTRHPMSAYERVLTDEGTYIMVGGSYRRIPGLLARGRWLARTSQKKLVLLMHEPNKDLAHLAELLESGQLVSIVDGPYPLQETPEALRALGEGRVRGKAVITMPEASA